MDTPEIATLKLTLQEKGLPHAEVGRQLGLDSSQVSRLMKGTRRLQVHEKRKLEQWLGVDLSSGDLLAVDPENKIAAMPGLVPLYAWQPDGESLQLNDAHLLGVVPGHPNQANFRGGFAVRVPNEDNSPRYEQGEVLYLVMNQSPARGQFCLVKSVNGKAWVRRFVGRTADVWRFESLNPGGEETRKASDLRGVHAVVGAG